MTPSHVLLITGARTWNNEAQARHALRALWRHWSQVAPVSDPLLIHGDAPKGADSLIARLWTEAGLPDKPTPADWGQHGKSAGYLRNQQMVDEARAYQDTGVQVDVLAFLDLCRTQNCSQASRHQLGDGKHYSHGTCHTRERALAAGLPVEDVILRAGSISA